MTLRFSGSIVGLGVAAGFLDALPNRVMDAAEIGARRGGLRVVGVMRSNQSGRPGPRVRTGGLRRSTTSVVRRSGDHVTGSVGTNHPAARRLENGFVGVDRIGRYFNQPRYPFVEPTVPAANVIWPEEIGKAIGQAIG